MDDIARHNMARWDELVAADIEYSRPWLDLDAATARQRLDPEGKMGEVAGADVLCLAGGGGQQSVAFALLGANVTVLELSRAQLARDEQAAKHYDVRIRTLHGDMRDLSAFGADAFDLVWHAHSLCFVPSAEDVLDQVAAVIRPGGKYKVSWSNPFYHGMEDNEWTGAGYLVRRPYVHGDEMVYDDPRWGVVDREGNVRQVPGPREWRHALGPVVNALIARGFAILGLWEHGDSPDPDAEPGTWNHYQFFCPPWVTLWAQQQQPAPGQ